MQHPWMNNINQCHSFENQLVMSNIMPNLEEDFQETLERSSYLRAVYAENKSLIDDVIKQIVLHQYQKAVSCVKVHFNTIRDRKGNRYIQARGALSIVNEKRRWVGCYLGPEREIINPSTGKIHDHWLKKGDQLVKEKIMSRLI
jgi:hypothetical protein